MRTLKRCSVASLGALALLSAGPAAAEIFVGGGVGVSQLSQYDDVDDGFAWKAFAGYRASDFPLYLEAQYFDSGDMDIDAFEFDGFTFDDVSIAFDGWSAAVGYRLVLGENGSDLILKGGGYVLDTKFESEGQEVASDDGSGGLIGVGGNWMFTPHFGLTFDVQILFGVPDLANEEDLTIATVGLVYSFFED